MAASTPYVALYCRLSPRPDGSYEGVEIQEDYGRAYAAERWPGVPVEVFADPGLSATKDDVVRPEYDRLREWIAAGKVAHIWSIEQSRLERREGPWFELAALLDGAGLPDLHTRRDGIVPVRDVVAGIKAVVNADEIRKLKKRVRDRHDANAAAGRPPGAHVFGYRHGLTAEGVKTYLVVDDQAQALRKGADWVLSGWSSTNVAREWMSAGLRGVYGGALGATAARRMLTNPTIAGLRVHRGVITGRGNWTPILDAATWRAVRRKLGEHRTVETRDGRGYVIGPAHGKSTARKYLQTGGLIGCDVCKAPLIGTQRKIGARSWPYYVCHPIAGGRACVTIRADLADAYLLAWLWDELDQPGFLDALQGDDPAERRDAVVAALDGLDEQRAELARLWSSTGADKLTTSEWNAARKGIADEEARLTAELDALPTPAERVDVEQARAAWLDMTLDEQRAFVRMYVGRVDVLRARARGVRFDGDERLRIHKREAG